MRLDEQRWFIRRLVLLIAGALLISFGLIGVASIAVPGVTQPACGCASPAPVGPPTPTPPVSQSMAQAAARRFTGVEMTSSGDWLDTSDRKVVELTGPNARAIVDGFSGDVLLAIRTDALPDTSAAGALTADAARSAAAAYLARADVSTTGFTTTTVGVDAFPAVLEVDFVAPDRAYRVFVNAVSGEVFASTLGSLDRTSVPLMSSEAAGRLAKSALPEAGDVVVDAQLQLAFDTHPVWTWQIGLGIPLPSDVYGGGGYVEVNASTGAAAVIKDAREKP